MNLELCDWTWGLTLGVFGVKRQWNSPLFVVGLGFDGNGKMDCKEDDGVTGLMGLVHSYELMDEVLNKRPILLNRAPNDLAKE